LINFQSYSVDLISKVKKFFHLSYKSSKINLIFFIGLDLSNFKTEQTFYTSKDGTKVPMFLISKKVRNNSINFLEIKNFKFLIKVFGKK
jgi:prolyl oligopeptidase PreP (S9A serine peptidase family)